MTQTIEQLEWRRAKLLKENPILVHLQNQIDATLDGETQVENCTMLINMCHQQVRLLQDSMNLVAKDIETLKELCTEYQLSLGGEC